MQMSVHYRVATLAYGMHTQKTDQHWAGHWFPRTPLCKCKFHQDRKILVAPPDARALKLKLNQTDIRIDFSVYSFFSFSSLSLTIAMWWHSSSQRLSAVAVCHTLSGCYSEMKSVDTRVLRHSNIVDLKLVWLADCEWKWFAESEMVRNCWIARRFRWCW